jgi:hypothetical protein
VRFHRVRAGLFAVAAVAALSPAQAVASSLVYLKGGDVYLGSPDGAAERRLTTGGGFESPSQADDGTVVAVERGEEGVYNFGLVHRISRTGQAIGAPTRCGPENSTTYTGPLGAEVSPDGALLAFHYFQFPEQSPTAGYCPIDRDAATSEFGEIGGQFNPSWISGDRVVLFATSGFPNVITDAPDKDSEGWFTEEGLRLDAGAADRALTKFAGIVSGGSEVRIYEMNGPPPAAPTARCSFTFEGASDHYEHPTWSPDGTQLAWDEPDGIHVADVPTSALQAAPEGCAQVTEELVIRGGQDPHWGRAAAPQSCIVPKLKGKTLRKAKRLLKKAGCTLGRVKRREAPNKKPGRVLSQRPKPGTVKPLGAQVRVVVSKR